MTRFVSDKQYTAGEVAPLSKQQQRLLDASPRYLFWLKFKQHRLAVYSAVVLILMYLSIIFCEWLAPYNLHTRNIDNIYAPPQSIHVVHDGQLQWPFSYKYDYSLNMELLKREYTENQQQPYPLRYFCHGDKYQFWGLIKTDLHLFCPAEDQDLFILGTDRLGRDIFSRILYGSRISLTIGLVGICVSVFFGILLGGLAGYFGGWIDYLVLRSIEIIRSFPELPLWMALSAILPVNWSPLWVFFGITVILAMLDWTGLARAVRAKFLTLREEDYCTSAQLMGASSGRIIFRHLLPGFYSHLIASISLSIPSMILGETALSFLGLGLRPPITSWGVLLNEAQNINAIALYPWLLYPVAPVILVIFAFNFLGDGIRDAADPLR